jgi:hypothetical protein
MMNVLRTSCVLAATAVVLAGCSSSTPSSHKTSTAPIARPSTSSGPPLITDSCKLITTDQITSLSTTESGGATLSKLTSSGGGIGGRQLCSWRFAQAKGKTVTALAGVSISLTPPVKGATPQAQCSFTAAGVTKTTPVPGVGTWAVAARQGACALTANYLLQISYFGQMGGNATAAIAELSTVLQAAVTLAGTGIA